MVYERHLDLLIIVGKDSEGRVDALQSEFHTKFIGHHQQVLCEIEAFTAGRLFQKVPNLVESLSLGFLFRAGLALSLLLLDGVTQSLFFFFHQA